jgi:hypothetical protein
MAKVNRDWFASIWRSVESGNSIEWADFDWFAIDRKNSIALLTTTSPGSVLRSVFRDMEAYLNVVAFFQDLPPTGNAEIVVSEYGRVDDWRDTAERGLYGFDFQGSERGSHGYKMIARPERPVHLGQVPGWVREWLEGQRLEDAVFADSVGRPLDRSGTGLEWF